MTQEEAAKLRQQYQEIYGEYFTTAYFKGFNDGYKEAIEQTKKWLLEQGKIDTLDAVELDMHINKLWEETK